MIGFVNRLLLDLWTENEFRNRSRVTHNTFRFLYEILGPYLKKKKLNLELRCRCRIRYECHCIGWEVVMDCKP